MSILVKNNGTVSYTTSTGVIIAAGAEVALPVLTDDVKLAVSRGTLSIIEPTHVTNTASSAKSAGAVADANTHLGHGTHTSKNI